MAARAATIRNLLMVFNAAAVPAGIRPKEVSADMARKPKINHGKMDLMLTFTAVPSAACAFRFRCTLMAANARTAGMMARVRRGNRGLMLLTELPRGDLVPLFKGADQMTAVRKAGLGCNIVQVIVGKKKQVFNLVQADKLDILLTALPVMLQKKFGKIGVAHVVFMCQCLDIDVFLGMAVEIDEDILHTLFLTLGNRFGIETDSLAVPDTQKPEKQCGKERIDIGIITVFLFKSLPLKGYKKIMEIQL